MLDSGEVVVKVCGMGPSELSDAGTEKSMKRSSRFEAAVERAANVDLTTSCPIPFQTVALESLCEEGPV